MKYLIPKEIKSRPRLFGLGLKQCAILLGGLFFIFTILDDLVHSFFIIPFYIISVLFLFWMVIPSVNNRGKQNYESLYLLFKKNRMVYHPIDVNQVINQSFTNEEK